MPEEKYKQMLSLLVSSVGIATTKVDAKNVGLTVSSFQSISVSPAIAMISISTNSRSSQLLDQALHVGVSMLSAGQEEIAKRYATIGSERFIDSDYFAGPFEIPLINSAIFHLLGKIVERHEIGNSKVYYFSVDWFQFGCGNKPLLYSNRSFLK